MSDREAGADPDQWQTDGLIAVEDFCARLKALQDTNPWPDRPVLDWSLNYLMTELWDAGFSQTEIARAFESAVADMPRYAAGLERRS